MAITFHPKAGLVLMCDFDGYVAPEIVKRRPVIIVSPNHLDRAGLHTVVPMSTSEPHRPQPYHHKLTNNPIPGGAQDVWAKCDLIATVRAERLDRIRVGKRGPFVAPSIADEDLLAIRMCLKYALGID